MQPDGFPSALAGLDFDTVDALEGAAHREKVEGLVGECEREIVVLVDREVQREGKKQGKGGR